MTRKDEPNNNDEFWNEFIEGAKKELPYLRDIEERLPLHIGYTDMGVGHRNYVVLDRDNNLFAKAEGRGFDNTDFINTACNFHHELLQTLRTIASFIGNVDHRKGHGVNSARMRGDMLDSIRTIAKEAIAKVETGVQP